MASSHDVQPLLAELAALNDAQSTIAQGLHTLAQQSADMSDRLARLRETVHALAPAQTPSVAESAEPLTASAPTRNDDGEGDSTCSPVEAEPDTPAVCDTPPSPTGTMLADTVESAEYRLGTQWLSRLGIIALLMGLTYALTYTFPHFPNPLKILTGFALGGVLFGLGHWLHARVAPLGRALQAGGVTTGYLSLFALFFIPDIRCIENVPLGLICLFAYVLGTMALSHRLGSQLISVLALLFGLCTAGYPESKTLVFTSAALLSVLTIGLARLNPSWRVIAKINLIGALALYGWAYSKFNLYNDGLGRLYMVGMFLLFHVVSLTRSPRGDAVLNLLNTGLWYPAYGITSAPLLPYGLLEAVLAAFQGLSFWLDRRWRAQAADATAKALPFAASALILALVFTGTATLRYFGTLTQCLILSVQAFALGWLSVRCGPWRRVLTVATYGFGALAFGSLWSHWSGLYTLWSALGLTLVVMTLEHGVFRSHSPWMRYSAVVLALMSFIVALCNQVDPHWRTVALVGTGFLLLISGLALRRKSHRWLALLVVLLVGGFSLQIDLAYLDVVYRIALFLVSGVLLLLGALAYQALEKRRSQP